LRRMAARHFLLERTGHTLQPTALVNELFLRLYERGPERYKNRAHFFGVAARAMRQILVEHSRHVNAQRRGGGWLKIPLEGLEITSSEPVDYFAIDEALTRFEALDPRAGEIVELRV